MSSMPVEEKDFRKSQTQEDQRQDAVDSVGKRTSKYESDDMDGQRKRKYLWCVKCCKKPKAAKTDSGKPKISFFARRKKKSKAGKGEGKDPSQRSSGISTIHHEESVEEPTKKPDKDKQKKRDNLEKFTKDSTFKKSKKSKAEEFKRKEAPETSGVAAVGTDTQRDEKLMKDRALKKEAPDFMKSCCHLCAQNAVAIAALISSSAAKSDESIQVSIDQYLKEITKSDKGCNAMLHVRTVQSSVKVKTRDMYTMYSEGSKNKRTKPKFKHKKFSIFPKVTRTKCPATRTVACETEKPMKHSNKVKCDVKREQCCRREEN